jgi:SAM-dependent methyltransferase
MRTTRRGQREVDAAVARLRQDLYRSAYYGPDGGAGDDEASSRRSGWASPAAQRRAYEVFLRVLPRDPRGAVLDLGCGDGTLLRWLVAASQGALVPYGVDFLPESIEAARFDAEPDHRDHFVVADATEFDPGQRQFALVLTALCYALPSKRRGFAARCRRWLEPGGRLILYEYRGSPLFESMFELSAQLALPVTERVREEDVALVMWRRGD